MGGPVGEKARGQRRRLEGAVESRIRDSHTEVLLYPGILASLACPYARRLHTLAVGLAGAPDLEYARSASDSLRCKHHEVTVRLKVLLAILPTIIHHLESFDAWLVCSRMGPPKIVD